MSFLKGFLNIFWNSFIGVQFKCYETSLLVSIQFDSKFIEILTITTALELFLITPKFSCNVICSTSDLLLFVERFFIISRYSVLSNDLSAFIEVVLYLGSLILLMCYNIVFSNSTWSCYRVYFICCKFGLPTFN